ncbi:hypothetical protein [Streptomyces sp. NBC_00582]|uniref:hypothetical protein n=1 Tax=Streptomyces sp. NBC_00582 TaxID=2975783 RepID=UPI001064198D|nr:hypothetical protein [Streptomyces sp. NBC_00582]WUB62989.1 hypothetical protein OG852_22570 [Streptomyces sp. NBC_00582]
MSGDHIQQYGSGNLGKVVHSGSGDIVTGGKHLATAPDAHAAALDTLLTELRALRHHLDPGRRAEVDAAVREIGANPSGEGLRGVLERIAGIAAVLGAVGTPVVTAVMALMGTS